MDHLAFQFGGRDFDEEELDSSCIFDGAVGDHEGFEAIEKRADDEEHYSGGDDEHQLQGLVRQLQRHGSVAVHNAEECGGAPSSRTGCQPFA